MSAFESGVMAPHIPHPLISIASFSPLAVVQIEDSLTARFARGSFILSVMTVQDVPLALWRARLAALACDSTTAEGRAVARPGHIGYWSQELRATAGSEQFTYLHCSSFTDDCMKSTVVKCCIDSLHLALAHLTTT